MLILESIQSQSDANFIRGIAILLCGVFLSGYGASLLWSRFLKRFSQSSFAPESGFSSSEELSPGDDIFVSTPFLFEIYASDALAKGDCVPVSVMLDQAAYEGIYNHDPGAWAVFVYVIQEESK